MVVTMDVSESDSEVLKLGGVVTDSSVSPPARIVARSFSIIPLSYLPHTLSSSAIGFVESDFINSRPDDISQLVAEWWYRRKLYYGWIYLNHNLSLATDEVWDSYSEESNRQCQKLEEQEGGSQK